MYKRQGLIGYRSEFMTDTKGNGIMNSLFDGYEPYKGDIVTRSQGSLVAFESGEAITYGLYNACLLYTSKEKMEHLKGILREIGISLADFK